MWVFHPAFGYFASRYGLVQRPIEFEGKEPSARRFARLVSEAQESRIRTLFVQPQFPRATAETAAELILADLVVLDPLSRDYRRNLRDIADRVAAGLKREESSE
jgi:zinc transport system substrate-binding protein